MSASNDIPPDRRLRRFRVDGFAQARSTVGPFELPFFSGRHFVVGAGVVFLLICGVLSLAFRDWRSHYDRRARFGIQVVAPAIDPLGKVVAQGVAPAAWQRAVDDTHAMLATLTSSNLVDLAGLQALHDEIDARVARSRPETALAELSSLWDDLSDRAEPVIAVRHPRPKILLPRTVKDPRSLRKTEDSHLNK
ncbi:hypothetical protein [Singulisphaera sp. PoT]|uniref:hypothetical protein n=1 Tax=Singulisphaera sp. PoT TaxID=3411797 RepID=UPI003BF48A65